MLHHGDVAHARDGVGITLECQTSVRAELHKVVFVGRVKRFTQNTFPPLETEEVEFNTETTLCDTSRDFLLRHSLINKIYILLTVALC